MATRWRHYISTKIFLLTQKVWHANSFFRAGGLEGQLQLRLKLSFMFHVLKLTLVNVRRVCVLLAA